MWSNCFQLESLNNEQLVIFCICHHDYVQGISLSLVLRKSGPPAFKIHFISGPIVLVGWRWCSLTTLKRINRQRQHRTAFMLRLFLASRFCGLIPSEINRVDVVGPTRFYSVQLGPIRSHSVRLITLLGRHLQSDVDNVVRIIATSSDIQRRPK